MSGRGRVVLRTLPTVDGWYGWLAIARSDAKVHPLGRLDNRTAASILLAEVLEREALGRVAAKLNVPDLPAGLP